ncbi:hypothetical protein [Adlercreutzia sp. ZJ176]|uniref:hypothetical protein n=1 Tax=Adlercreutzia sp. ZJ176 TaxID=2709407 RepID=UPI0013E9DA6B|nr:hypothetical protein [Adlercreutzia sp. ZJ176]
MASDLDVQTGRLRRAVGVVAALALVLACSAAIGHASASGARAAETPAKEAAAAGLQAGEALAREAAESAHAEADAAAGPAHVRDLTGRMLAGEDVLTGELAAAGEAPRWFADELFPLADEEDVMASDGWTVVGFSMGCGAQEALEDVAARLREHGWQGYESGVAGVATFEKEEGTCRWAMVSCAQMPAGTSVVVRVQRAA